MSKKLVRKELQSTEDLIKSANDPNNDPTLSMQELGKRLGFEFVSAEDLAKVRADLRAMAEEQKRPLPPLVELAMATHNVALQNDPTWLSSFAWAAAVDAIIEECAKIADRLSNSASDHEAGAAIGIADDIRALKSSQ